VNGTLKLTAIVADPDGSEVLREQQIGNDAEELGTCVGKALLAGGADSILRAVYGEAVATPQQP
jgi:hydroxymethylbilane synthase